MATRVTKLARLLGAHLTFLYLDETQQVLTVTPQILAWKVRRCLKHIF